MSGRPRFRKAGFTLLEIALAVVLLSAVLTAMYITWSTGLQGWKSGAESADSLQKTRAIMDGLTELFRSAAFYDQSDEDEDNDDLYMVEGIHGTYGDNDADSVTFVTLSSRFLRPYEAERMPLRRVKIALEQDENKQPYLALYSQNALLPPESRETAPIKLSDSVVGFRVRYYDPDVEDWQDEWKDEGGMPGQVEVSIVYKADEEGQKQLYQQMITGLPAREAAQEQTARRKAETRKQRQQQPRTAPKR
jgi:prepilin-type N-terminal cleavage/methylation domain-containing protein